jgi:hypothetical protein
MMNFGGWTEPTAPKGAHAHLLHIGALQHRTPARRRQPAPARSPSRGEQVRGLVRHVAGVVRRFGQDAAALHAALEGVQLGLVVLHQGDGLYPLLVLLRLLQPVEAVQTHHRPLRDRLGAGLRVQAGDARAVNDGGDGGGAGRATAAEGGSGDVRTASG